MATIKPSYRATNQTITCTINSLGSGSARQSTYIDNTSNLDDDDLVVLVVKTAASGTSSTGHVDLYFYGSADLSTYPDAITGTDGTYTMVSPSNLFLVRSVNAVSNGTTYESEPISVSAAFGGVVPPQWGIVVVNNSGAALASTGNSAFFAGVQYTVA